MKNYKFYEQVNHNFDKAAPFTRFDKGILNQIKVCNTVYKVVFPIKRDDGSIQVIEGWRVEHSHHKLPTKGGIRYSHKVDDDETMATADDLQAPSLMSLLGCMVKIVRDIQTES